MRARPLVPRTVAARWLRLALLAVILLGAGLRFFRADHQEIWGDEGAKLEVVNQDLAHLFWPGAEVHPRFFHSWLFIWFRLVGYQPYALRLLPALFGVLGLPLVYVLARRLLGSRAAAVGAAAVLAVSPFHVSYSQDLTMYTLLFAVLCVTGYTLVRALAAPGWRAWALYGLVCLLAVHTHYYAAFAIAAQGLFVLARARRALPRWVGAQLLVAAGFLPWLWVQYRLLAGQAVDQVEDFSLAHLGALLRQAALGFTVGGTFPAEAAWIGWVFVAAALAVLAALLARPATRTAGALLGLWLLGPPLLVWVFDIWLQHFGERFVSMSLPPLVVLGGAVAHPGLWARWPAARRVAAGGLAAAYLVTAAIALRGWYYDPAFLKSHYGEMMALIAERAAPGDLLLLNGRQQSILYELYQPPGLDHRYVSPDSVISPEAAARDFPQLVAGHDRIWLVLYGAPETYDPEHQAEAWLGQHGFKAFYQSFPGNYVTLFVLGDAALPELTDSEAQFVDGPRLLGYAIDPREVEAGGVVFLTLLWQAEAPITFDYTVFAHIVWPDGQVLAQSDSQPVGGTRPTTTWAVGEQIVDRYALLVPPETPAGEFTLQVGLYDWRTGQRLALEEAGAPEQIILGTIRTMP